MRVRSAILSEVGPREENEDCAAVWTLSSGETGVAVADGLGGHFGGKFAAELAVNCFKQAVNADTRRDPSSIAREIHTAIQEEQLRRPEWFEMATTLSAGVIYEDRFLGVHCGDTRIAVSRGAGIKRITQDHTEVRRLVVAGKLTSEEALNYHRKNILESALGIKGTLKVDPIEFPLICGDKLFLTSDGVHGKLKLRELFDISSRLSDPNSVAVEVRAELERRGPEDNFTLVCCFIE